MWVNVYIFTNLENALEGGKKLLKICECVMFPFHPLWTLTKPYIYTFILINFLERCKDAWSKLLAIRIIYSPILPHPQSDDIKLSITGIISATYEIYQNCKISTSGLVTFSLSVSCEDRRRFNQWEKMSHTERYQSMPDKKSKQTLPNLIYYHLKIVHIHIILEQYKIENFSHGMMWIQDTPTINH